MHKLIYLLYQNLIFAEPGGCDVQAMKVWCEISLK